MNRTDRHLWGLLAEFTTPEALLEAARRAYEDGYRRLDAYTPFPVEGLAESIGFTRNRIPTLVLVGGLLGAATAYLMMWYSATIHYPINVGGRPLHSAPAFIPITFECGILLSALTAFFGVLAWMGYPRLYHPVFEAPGFRRASIDRFGISIEMAGDDPAALQAELKELGAEETDFVTEQLN